MSHVQHDTEIAWVYHTRREVTLWMQPVIIIVCAGDYILTHTITDDDLYKRDIIADLGCLVNREDKNNDVEKHYSAPRN